MKQNEEKVDLDTQENNKVSREKDVKRATLEYIVSSAKKQIKIMDDAVNGKLSEQNEELIKRYKREVANLHRALSKIKKDKEQLLVENLRLKEILNNNNK